MDTGALPTRELGRTGMRITTIGLGGGVLGGSGQERSWGPENDAESVAAVRHAVARGINWIDTAPLYGQGRSEELVGAALSGLPEPERPYVFTKCGMLTDSDGLRRDLREIRREVHGSLRRLRLERIDLLLAHWPPDHGPSLAEYWQVLLDLRSEGLVRAVGLSNHGPHLLDRAEAIGRVDCVQPKFSLLSRVAADDVVAWSTAHSAGVIGYTPIERGLLAGAFTAEQIAALPPRDWRRTAPFFTAPALERNLRLVEALRPIAARHRVNLAAVAIAWCLIWPGVTGAIVGARRPAQIDDWLPAAAVDLTGADLDEIAEALLHTGAGTGPTRPPV